MTITLIHLIAAVTLLLWSTRFVTASITNAFGGNLRAILSSSTRNRFTAFGTGFGITALLQSSTATALMTTSFVKNAQISLTAAIAITIGADLSTTIVAQILIFDLSLLPPMLLICGTAALTRDNTKTKAIGNALIGLGLILISLSMIRDITEPLKDSHLLVEILQGLSKEPPLAIIFSAILTWLMHSSLATVLFFAALTSQGIITLPLALLFVLGANIGGAFIPYIATYKEGTAVKRLTTLSLIMRGIVIVLAYPLIPLAESLITQITADPARQIVIAHTGFNVILVILFLPLTHILTKLGYALIKENISTQSNRDSYYLDESTLDKPTIALASAMRETLRMADLVETMTDQVFSAIKQNDQQLLEQAQGKDNQLDDTFRAIKLFLTRLKHDTLTEGETAQMEKIMAYATNLEHCGDLIQHSMSDTVKKKIATRDKFSDEGWKEIKDFYKAVIANMQTAQSVFISSSIELAGEMIETKKQLKQTEFKSRRQHFNRLSKQEPRSLATSTIHIDLMRDLGRINSYVTSVAYETLNKPTS